MYPCHIYMFSCSHTYCSSCRWNDADTSRGSRLCSCLLQRCLTECPACSCLLEYLLQESSRLLQGWVDVDGIVNISGAKLTWSNMLRQKLICVCNSIGLCIYTILWSLGCVRLLWALWLLHLNCCVHLGRVQFCCSQISLWDNIRRNIVLLFTLMNNIGVTSVIIMWVYAHFATYLK